MLQWYILCACKILHILVALNLYQQVPLGDEAQVEPCFGPYLKQDRCTVCVEYTIGSKIILDASNGTLR
jgi:hypothetical protein